MTLVLSQLDVPADHFQRTVLVGVLRLVGKGVAVVVRIYLNIESVALPSALPLFQS